MPIALSGSRKKLRTIVGCGAAVSMFLAGGASSAAAATAAPEIPTAPVSTAVAAVASEATSEASTEFSVCPGQTFAQPFQTLGDSNYYTLAEGSEFNNGPEGWELLNGAKIIQGTRPDGSTGNILDMPAGAVAISPPSCVTLQYPTARTYAESVKGGSGVSVTVAYGLQSSLIANAGQLKPQPHQGWEVSAPFKVQPQLTGSKEGTREVRFVYSTKNAEEHIFGLYVDPRLSH